MTIGSTSPARVSFNCDGVTTVFPVPIQAYQPTDITVTLTAPVSAGGGSTTLTLNSDYSLATSGTLQPTAWTLTTLAATPYAAGYTLQAFVNPVQQQQTQFVQGQAFPSLSVQTLGDRLTQMLQRVSDQVSRAVHAPDGDVAPVMLLPVAALRALTYLGFDANGNLSLGQTLPSGTLSQSSIGNFLYPRTTAETGLLIPAPWFPWGHVSRYGAVGNGIADDTVAIQSAATGGAGIVWAPAGTYKITSEITLNYVQLLIEGNVLFTGTGSFRGIIENTSIPHAAFQVPYNLVTAAERNQNVTTGNYYLDPLLGVDTNAGTSAPAAVRTLTKIAALIASVAATAPSLTIIVRSGRVETSGLTLNSAHTLTSGGNVNWVANAGESPTISGPTKWFFRSSAVTATSGVFTGVANALAYPFWDLYDAETGIQVDCASNMGSNFSLPRNQVAAVTVTGASAPFTVGITLNSRDTTNFTALSATEKAGARLRLSHWFTSSWHMSLSIAGSVLTGDCNVDVLAHTATYANGWNSDGIDTYGCPYLLQNIKAYLDGTNFCAFADNVWLPNRGSNYFTVDNTVNFLIDTGAAAKHYFYGLKFRYLAAGFNTVKTLWAAGPFPRLGMLIGSTGAHGAYNCKFEYGNLNGASMSYTGAQYIGNECNFTGLGGISFDNTVNGSDNAVIQRNKVRRWGHYTSLATCGIWGGGVNVDMEYNDCRNGPWTALRFETRGNIVAPSGNSSGNVLRNVCMEVGYVNGAPADYACNNDSGVLTIFGNSGSNNVNINENVVGRGFAYGVIRNLFADQGISGIVVWNNLCWGASWYALDFRQVSALTFNNSFRDNILLGRVNVASTNNTTDFSGNIVASSVGNFIDNVIINVTPNFFGIRCVGSEEYPAIAYLDSAFSGTPPATQTPVVQSFLKRLAFVDDGPVWESLSIPLPVTTATYTVLNSDKELRFNRAGTVTVTLPTAANCWGRELYMLTLQAQAVASASTNVVPLTGGAAANPILAATAGKWAKLVSDGSAWNIMAAN